MSLPPLSHTWIDHIPVLWTEPNEPTEPGPVVPRRLVLWLPGLSGSKESCERYLRELAAQGFVALSFDPWQHGERAHSTETPQQLATRVFSNFRRHMWPILAHTTEDTLRVIDWAISSLGVSENVCMGGISMGGDISVAAAGLDRRVQVVAATVATPDWLRPGMNVSAGQPDSYARRMYDQLNPLTHLAAYAHCPAITFECGAIDPHVPNDGALRFQAALRGTYETCPERLRVTLHPGVEHAFTDAMWANCIEWFKRF
jgi:uncharacterized protein